MIYPKKDFATNKDNLIIIGIASFIGVFSSLSAFILIQLIRFFTNLFIYQTLSFAPHSPTNNTLGLWIIVVPILGGLIIGFIARFGSDKIRGHGIPEAIEAVLFKKSAIRPRIAILKPLSSAIAIGSGGPFGAEGPIIMTGGAIGSIIAQHISITTAERKTLLVAGASAGMTAIFGTPMAAVLLAIELLLFELRPRSLLPVAIACTVAGFIRPLLIDSGPLFPISTNAPNLLALPSSIFTGLLCGVLAAFLSSTLYKVEDAFAKIPIHWMWWPAIGGLAVGIGGYLQPAVLGIGFDVITNLLNNHFLPTIIFSIVLVKAIIWIIALGSGTSGGVLAPILMIGAGLGSLLSQLLQGGDPLLWPMICMSSLLAGIIGTPLTAIVLALELTHNINALLPLLLSTIVAHGYTVLMTHRSIMTEKIARRGLHTYREYGVDPLERIHVEDLMTSKVKTIPSTLSLNEALELFFGEDQQHRAYPVTNDNNVLLGVIDRSCLINQSQKFHSTSKIEEIMMIQKPVVAYVGETCRAASSRMAVNKLERLPVIEDNGSHKLIGIISRSDFVKPAVDVFEAEEKRETLLKWVKKYQ